MKILLLVQRESDSNIPPWVEDACDEYTMDEWNGKLPDCMQKKVDDDPANYRTLWVSLPDECLDRLWEATSVDGAVLA